VKEATLYTSKKKSAKQINWFVILVITAAVAIVSLNIVNFIVSY